MTTQSIADFVATHPNRRFELINGEIVVKVHTELHGLIVAFIITELMLYTRQHKRGRVMTEARYRPDETNERLPDVTLTFDVARPIVTEGAVTQMPDLAVEIKSPTDSYIGMRETAAYTLKHGVKMVWLIYPEKQLVEVYQPQQDIQLLTPTDTLEGGDLLPEFTLAVQSMFDL